MYLNGAPLRWERMDNVSFGGFVAMLERSLQQCPGVGERFDESKHLKVSDWEKVHLDCVRMASVYPSRNGSDFGPIAVSIVILYKNSRDISMRLFGENGGGIAYAAWDKPGKDGRVWCCDTVCGYFRDADPPSLPYILKSDIVRILTKWECPWSSVFNAEMVTVRQAEKVNGIEVLFIMGEVFSAAYPTDPTYPVVLMRALVSGNGRNVELQLFGKNATVLDTGIYMKGPGGASEWFSTRVTEWFGITRMPNLRPSPLARACFELSRRSAMLLGEEDPWKK